MGNAHLAVGIVPGFIAFVPEEYVTETPKVKIGNPKKYQR
jgi:predicted RNA-binding protein with TRAM domain